MTWHSGTCRKDGSGTFNIKPMEECTKEIIKKGGETADEKDQSSEAKITRKAQAGGMHHK